MGSRKDHLPSEPNTPEGEPELAKTVVRSTPWITISIAAHAIVIAILSVQFVKSERPPSEFKLTSFLMPESAIDTVIEPPPEEIVRNEVPELLEEPTIEFDEPALVESDVASEIAESTEESTGLLAPGTGFEGATSIGTSDGGHEGLRVSPHAGTLGHGNGTGGPGGKYRVRSKGSPHSKSLKAALDWLARHQDAKGFWSSGNFSTQCQENRCSGAGDASHDIGATGLALLAFLGAGQTHTAGTYRDNVARAVSYLAEVQDPATGRFGDENGAQGYLYDQAIAALAICEAYGLSNNATLKKCAQRAVNYCQSARNPYKAWRYAVPGNGENDVSVTGWMVMVLRSAKDFGLQVDDQAFDGAALYLDEMTDPQSGRTGYISRGGLSSREPGNNERWPASKVEGMTAVAMLSRIFMGQVPDSTPALRLGADLLRKALPTWDESNGVIDYYYWYYGSFAMFQMGGKDWEVWEKKMVEVLEKHQETQGCERGSWNPAHDPWGARGGRIYSTALLCLCAEVHIRYGRVIGARDH